MRAWSWLVLAALGFGLMLWAYLTRPRPDPGTPWAAGAIVIGPTGPGEKPLPGPSVPARLRLLPGSETAEAILGALGEAAPGGALSLRLELRPKLFSLSLSDAGIGPGLLQSGRLPVADRDEVLAGARGPRRDRLSVGDRTLNVVGALKPDVALFADSYLAPGPVTAGGLFPEGDDSVHPATLIRATPEQARSRKFLEQLDAAYPSLKFTRMIPVERLGRRTFSLYLTGQALFLLGGSGALIGLYRWLAVRKVFPWLAVPLQEIRQRPVLVWGVHLVYFGLVMLGSVVIYSLPEVQAVLVSSVRSQLTGKSGPLALAGKAYLSGNIPLAAAVTFLVNFVLGSILVISLPSVILPGAGAIIACVRAVTWGLLLAPTFVMNAAGMLPHSGTMLLEGEGYILAALFGLLIPVRMAESRLGGTPLTRYGRAVLLNLQANVLVAIVLAVAACYEAVEVIQMAGGLL
jgi:hypothetical protein